MDDLEKKLNTFSNKSGIYLSLQIAFQKLAFLSTPVGDSIMISLSTLKSHQKEISQLKCDIKDLEFDINQCEDTLHLDNSAKLPFFVKDNIANTAHATLWGKVPVQFGSVASTNPPPPPAPFRSLFSSPFELDPNPGPLLSPSLFTSNNYSFTHSSSFGSVFPLDSIHNLHAFDMDSIPPPLLPIHHVFLLPVH